MKTELGWKEGKERNSFGHNLQADKKCLWPQSCASLAGTADTEKMLTFSYSSGTGRPGTSAQLEMEMGTRGSLRTSLSCLPATGQKEIRTGCRNGHISAKRPGGHNSWYSLQNSLETSGFQEKKQRGAKMKLELFKIPQTRTLFFLIYHTKRLSAILFSTQHSNIHPQYWLWGLTWYCNLSPAPNTNSSPKINLSPKVPECLKRQLLFLPQAISCAAYKATMIQKYQQIWITAKPAPKPPLPMQVPRSTTRNEAADSWFQTLISSYPARKLLMESKHTGTEERTGAVQNSRSQDTGWLGNG